MEICQKNYVPKNDNTIIRYNTGSIKKNTHKREKNNFQETFSIKHTEEQR